MISDGQLKTILVWDLSTRFFHWLLAALVALAWATGEAEGSLSLVHKLAGYGVLAAILFRLIWGFVGGEHARFRDFIHPWSVVSGYAKGLLTLRPRPSIGHNPLGGWMIMLLLATIMGVAGTGLFAFEEELAGPLTGSISADMGQVLAGIHEALAYFLLFLIGIHVAGVFVDSLLTGHNLIRSMVTGRKAVSTDDDAEINVGYLAPYWYSAVALSVAMGVTWLLVG